MTWACQPERLTARRILSKVCGLSQEGQPYPSDSLQYMPLAYLLCSGASNKTRGALLLEEEQTPTAMCNM
ncbi:unnamed protein product [marine sediment metagenome]|uniref:Uncharacterized protein n=1 Tax=marine sediment metagenome TaxID=412755 RepID=X1T1W3_9ZZZZ